jgi:hypothetical protein
MPYRISFTVEELEHIEMVEREMEMFKWANPEVDVKDWRADWEEDSLMDAPECGVDCQC